MGSRGSGRGRGVPVRARSGVCVPERALWPWACVSRCARAVARLLVLMARCSRAGVHLPRRLPLVPGAPPCFPGLCGPAGNSAVRSRPFPVEKWDKSKYSNCPSRRIPGSLRPPAARLRTGPPGTPGPPGRLRLPAPSRSQQRAGPPRRRRRPCGRGRGATAPGGEGNNTFPGTAPLRFPASRGSGSFRFRFSEGSLLSAGTRPPRGSAEPRVSAGRGQRRAPLRGAVARRHRGCR